MTWTKWSDALPPEDTPIVLWIQGEPFIAELFTRFGELRLDIGDRGWAPVKKIADIASTYWCVITPPEAA